MFVNKKPEFRIEQAAQHFMLSNVAFRAAKERLHKRYFCGAKGDYEDYQPATRIRNALWLQPAIPLIRGLPARSRGCQRGTTTCRRLLR